MTDLSKLALGTVQFGLVYGISNKYGRPDQSTVNETLSYAQSKGIKTLDTASAYGDAEKVIGQYVTDEFDIVTKFLPTDIEKGLVKNLNISLENLKKESVYGFLAHRTNSISEDVWELLKDLKEKGLVKKIGFSLQTVDECKKVLDRGFIPDLVQVPYNLFDHRFKDLCIELKKLNTEIHSRSTFLQGLFFVPSEGMNSFFNKVKDPIAQLQSKYETKLSQFLLKYCLSQNFIDKVIIGVQNKKQLEQNVLGLENIGILEEINMVIPEEILNPALWPKN